VPQVHKWCNPVLDGHLDAIWISLLLHAILWSIDLRGCFGGLLRLCFLFSTYQSWRQLGTEPMTTCTTCNNEMQRNNEHAKLCLRFGLFPLLILAKHFSFLSFPVFAGRRTFAEFSLWLARLFRTPDLVDSLDI